MFHFGQIRPHSSGKGTVGEFSLHVQCAWRLDQAQRIITGSEDLWEFGGLGDAPDNWNPSEGGFTVLDRELDELLRGYDKDTRSSMNLTDKLIVTSVSANQSGDVTIHMKGDYCLRLFPTSPTSEAWRFFASSDKTHLVFPPEK
jgi:hypothetical protein